VNTLQKDRATFDGEFNSENRSLHLFFCLYGVIKDDCRGFNNLSYTVHL